MRSISSAQVGTSSIKPIHAVHRADSPLTLPAQRLLEAFVAEAQAQRTAFRR